MRFLLLIASFSIVSTFPTGETPTEEPITPTEVFEEITELPVFDLNPGTDQPFVDVELEEEEERSTTSPPEEEYTPTTITTPTVSDPLTPEHNEIIQELENIWHYSERLDEARNYLKSSLSSLVQLTYQRVHDPQPPGTLPRLKVLLRQLRHKLEETEEHGIEPKTQRKSRRRKKRSGADQNELKEMQENSLENGLLPPPDNSIKDAYEIVHYLEPLDIATTPESASIPASVSTAALSEASEVSTEASSEATFSPPKRNPIFDSSASLPYVVVVPLKPSNSDNVKEQLPPSSPPPPTFKTPPPNLIDLLQLKNTTKNELNSILKPLEEESDDESLIPSTVDEIVQSIIAVLKEPPKPFHPLQRQPPPHPTPPNPFESFLHLKNNSLPFYMNKFIGFPPSLQDFVAASSNVTALQGTPPATSSDLGLIKTPSSSSSISMLNSTMDRISLGLSIFSNLSNTSIVTLLFTLGISALSIAVGYFSLGAPTILLGVLGIVIILAYQANLIAIAISSGGKKKEMKKKESLLKEGRVDLDFNEMLKILGLISQALIKYNP